MGEVVILSEWKRKKELKTLQDLEASVDAWINYFDIRHRYFIFESNGNMIEIYQKENS